MRWPMALGRQTARWGLGGLLVLLAGCATYDARFAPIDASLVRNDPAGALALLEKQSFSERDRLLFHLDRAMLLRMLGQYAESNRELEAAKGIIQAYDPLSVSEQTAAFFINDATIAYSGVPLERVMVHVFAALNYLELGQPEAARVEVLQIDLLLRQLAERAPEPALGVDPFARYLSGMIFEALGEDSDALIAYRKALEAYRLQQPLTGLAVPAALQADLLRLTRRLGLADEHERLRARFPHAEAADPSADRGRVVLFVANGLAPVKREVSDAIVDPASGILVRISLPVYELRPSLVRRLRLRVGDTVHLAEPVENLSALARATLDAALPAITARAMARAVAKYQMAREAGKQDDLAGLLMNVVNVITERADTRSWLTLPGEIRMARLSLPPGRHRLVLELLDDAGNLVDRHVWPDVTVRAGRIRFISYHYPVYRKRGHP